MTSEDRPTTTSEDRAHARANNLLPEERAAGSDDPAAQAESILSDSDARQLGRSGDPDAPVEHRRSDDTVEPTD